ncbi:SufE family protein [Niabella ginsengisoli]|uniref:SufE family protein n=1 Tax=Niabella ginsengisoli TaxID=522298 RepID=A0ABS9SR23_9BACT|nr:SufE family protein [Niabella ginsengisoli]MCH5600839.1 SufE family protein [Niabella ginsengisoli]
MHLNKAQDKIIDEFEAIVDQVKSKFRYFRHVANLGSLLPTVTSIQRTNEKLIKLTKSKIWLDAEYKDGKVYYSGDSDSKIMRGILLLYIRVFSGRTPNEIVDSDIYFTNEIDLHHYLSQDRRGEIASLLQRIRSVAAGYKVQSLGNKD